MIGGREIVNVFPDPRGRPQTTRDSPISLAGVTDAGGGRCRSPGRPCIFQCERISFAARTLDQHDVEGAQTIPAGDRVGLAEYNWALTDLNDDCCSGAYFADGTGPDGRSRVAGVLGHARFAWTRAVHHGHPGGEPVGVQRSGISRRSSSLHADGWHDMHVHARVNGDLSDSGEPLL